MPATHASLSDVGFSAVCSSSSSSSATTTTSSTPPPLVCAAGSSTTAEPWDGDVLFLRLVVDHADVGDVGEDAPPPGRLGWATAGSIRTACGVSAAAWVDEERVLVGGDDGDARVVRRSGSDEEGFFVEAGVVGDHDDVVTAVEALRGTEIVATGAADGVVRLWDVSTAGTQAAREAALRSTPTTEPVVAIHQLRSANLNALAIVDSRGRVALHDAIRDKNPARKADVLGQTPLCVTGITSLGVDLILGLADGSLSFVDIRTMAVVATEPRRHRAAIRTLAVTPAGTLLTGGDDGVAHGLGAHRDFCRGSALVPDPRNPDHYVPVTCSWDGTVVAWDASWR